MYIIKLLKSRVEEYLQILLFESAVKNQIKTAQHVNKSGLDIQHKNVFNVPIDRTVE